MNGIEHATPAILVMTVAIVLAFFLFLKKTQAGKEWYIRRLRGIDMVDEAIARSAELGRPSVFCSGLTGVGPVLYAVLSLLSHIAKQVARSKVKFLVPQNAPDVLAMVESTTEEAYQSVNKGSAFDPKSIVYLSDEQFAFASGYMGLVHREKAASAFLFGTFAAESLILAEAGQQVGAMQVAGSVSPEQTAFFVCTCDYTLIGEELFAASAYLDRDPVQVASIVTQDATKFLCLLIVAIGIGIATYNSITGRTLANIDAALGFSTR